MDGQASLDGYLENPFTFVIILSNPCSIFWTLAIQILSKSLIVIKILTQVRLSCDAQSHTKLC